MLLQVLCYTAGHINYGGRITDDWDRRCAMSILSEYYQPQSLDDDHSYSPSGIYHQLDGSTDHAVSSPCTSPLTPKTPVIFFISL